MPEGKEFARQTSEVSLETESKKRPFSEQILSVFRPSQPFGQVWGENVAAMAPKKWAEVNAQYKEKGATLDVNPEDARMLLSWQSDRAHTKLGWDMPEEDHLTVDQLLDTEDQALVERLMVHLTWPYGYNHEKE